MTVYYPQAALSMKIVWESFGDDVSPLLKREHALSAIARRTRVTINSYTEADTFEVELDYKIFPFDPRTVRSLQLGIHVENMKELFDDQQQPVQIEPSVENTMFLGFADKEEMSFDDTTRTVRIKGRDFTGLFIDTTWPKKALSLNKPLDVILAQILAELKSAGDITVDNRTGGSLPVLGAFYPDFGALSGKRNARSKETYWDVIQDIVSKAGLIAYIELDKLVIHKPRTLYERSEAIQFIYGRNLSELELTRNLGTQKGFNVRVRSIIGKEVLSAEIPREAIKLEGAGQELKIPKQYADGRVELEPAPFFSFNVANVRNKAHLIEMGEGIFEELGRQQLEGRLTTMDMEAAQDNGDCFDLTKLRNGSPLLILIDVDDLVEIQKQKDQGTRFKYLIQRCYPTQVATIFAATMGKFSTPFYTRSVDFTVEAEQGFRLEVDFVNFIETAGKGFGL